MWAAQAAGMASRSRAISCCWAGCAAPDLRRSRKCSTVVLPCLAQHSPGYRLPKVSDLPAVKWGLPHDLLKGHLLRADQPVGMQLPERVQVRHNPPWGLDAVAREAGEGQPCAQLPQVLRLCWDCSPLLCCERHGQPSAEEGLPRHALGPQQAADDLGLESCQLCWDVHKGYGFLLQGPRRDGSAGEQVRCPCGCRPVGCHKGVHRRAELPRMSAGTGTKVPW